MKKEELIIEKLKLVYANVRYVGNNYYIVDDGLMYNCEHKGIIHIKLDNLHWIKIYNTYCEGKKLAGNHLWVIKLTYDEVKIFEYKSKNIIILTTYPITYCERLIYVGFGVKNKFTGDRALILDTEDFTSYYLDELLLDEILKIHKNKGRYSICWQDTEVNMVKLRENEYNIELRTRVSGDLGETYIETYKLGTYTQKDLVDKIENKRS